MIGILYIATGKYKIFFDIFYSNVLNFFIPEKEKKIFVFTDDVNYFNKYQNLEIIKIDHLGFPLNSLLRFKYFNQNKDIFDGCEKLVFMNANLLIINTIKYEDFFKFENQYNFWGVNHPGWFHRSNVDFPYERNSISESFINHGEGKYYFQGCLFAGKTDYFLNMCHILDCNIQSDLQKNYIAIWHDESHLNKYFSQQEVCLLDPGFAYPETWHIPFEKKIIQLSKEVFFNKLDINYNVQS